jgi:hypothetical protein
MYSSDPIQGSQTTIHGTGSFDLHGEFKEDGATRDKTEITVENPLPNPVFIEIRHRATGWKRTAYLPHGGTISFDAAPDPDLENYDVKSTTTAEPPSIPGSRYLRATFSQNLADPKPPKKPKELKTLAEMMAEFEKEKEKV